MDVIAGIDAVTLFSENAKRLAEFYKDKVGIKFNIEAELGDEGDNLYGLDVKGGSSFYIVDHSKVKGKNSMPERMMINFEVSDIEKEVKDLKKSGVKKIQDIYHVEDYGFIATFEDVDGNYFQLVQIRP